MARRKPKNWIQGAIKHPGASTRAAAAEGITLSDWITKHYHDKGVSGRRARLARTLRKMH
jgi:hypothetical protein